MLTIAHPHADLAARFRSIILGLCAVVLAYIAEDDTAGPLVGAIYIRLRRCSVRFDALVARLGAGLLPVRRRAARAGAPRVHAPGLLPRRHGWLAALLGHEAAAYGGYDGRLGYLLRDPDMVALLAASPHIGGVLRPLWRMLSTDKLPKVLRPPPREPEVSVLPRKSGAAPVGPNLVAAPPGASPELPDAAHVEVDASPPFGPHAPISA